jgi:hypothetical protein
MAQRETPAPASEHIPLAWRCSLRCPSSLCLSILIRNRMTGSGALGRVSQFENWPRSLGLIREFPIPASLTKKKTSRRRAA